MAEKILIGYFLRFYLGKAGNDSDFPFSEQKLLENFQVTNDSHALS